MTAKTPLGYRERSGGAGKPAFNATDTMPEPLGWIKLGIALGKRLIDEADWLPIPKLVRVLA